MISRSSDLLHDWEWSDGFWPELRSGKPEGEVMCIKVDKVSGLVMIGLTDMLVISVLVFILSL